MASQTKRWSLMRIDDVPKDSAGVLVVKDGLAWMAVARGLVWPEATDIPKCVDLTKMVVGADDMDFLIHPPIVKGLGPCPCSNPDCKGDYALGMAMGAHPMSRIYCGAYPDETDGGDFVGMAGDTPWEVRLSATGIRVRGAVVISIVPDPCVSKALGSHETQPICFQTKRIRGLLRQEIASMRRGEDGLCPVCHAHEATKCQCKRHVPLPDSGGEVHSLEKGLDASEEADAMRLIRETFSIHGLDPFDPTDPATTPSVTIKYQDVRRLMTHTSRLFAASIRLAMKCGAEGKPFNSSAAAGELLLKVIRDLRKDED
jgi:hypothetical protein